MNEGSKDAIINFGCPFPNIFYDYSVYFLSSIPFISLNINLFQLIADTPLITREGNITWLRFEGLYFELPYIFQPILLKVWLLMFDVWTKESLTFLQ